VYLIAGSFDGSKEPVRACDPLLSFGPFPSVSFTWRHRHFIAILFKVKRLATARTQVDAHFSVEKIEAWRS